ncbi:hypothetical protein PCANC_14647 [Puccinia coronata f. sp. avenae]|uniref:polynucleotide adenylyltransferase n=1 Tax=Puccinia coronata f. sp. avenae TaxID=200324 RepID=A0A2N5SW02_9BASI|nr:hypothetical protein PCANC_14647 [Puccinia coronata f. sp. avenae]
MSLVSETAEKPNPLQPRRSARLKGTRKLSHSTPPKLNKTRRKSKKRNSPTHKLNGTTTTRATLDSTPANPNWSSVKTTLKERQTNRPVQFISHHLTRQPDSASSTHSPGNNTTTSTSGRKKKRRNKNSKQPIDLQHQIDPQNNPTSKLSKKSKKKLTKRKRAQQEQDPPPKMGDQPLAPSDSIPGLSQTSTTTNQPSERIPGHTEKSTTAPCEGIPGLGTKAITTNEPLGFIENADFIRFEESDQEANGSPTKPNKNKNAPSRGTKRKLGAVVTEEQAEAVRKKKGAIITPWFDQLSWKGRNVQQMLTAEIGSFVAYIQPTHEEHELRNLIIQMIRRTVQSKWPDADVEPFGSFGTKLYLPAGDIDLVIISAQMINEQKSRILYKLAPLIRENNIGQDVVVIAKAKVPIIKFKTIFGNINVDISINQTNGIIAMKKVTELLDDIKYLSRDIRRSSRTSRDDHRSSSSRNDRNNHHPSRRDHYAPPPKLSDEEQFISRVVEDLGAAKCLILVIKSVLKQRGMNEVYTGGLGSYSIICLVVSFLQLHPKIQRGDVDPNKNLGVLLLEFFELYGKNFNFDQTGISVRRGGYYFSKAHRGWQRERQPYLLSIEDPADESNDIAGGSHNILSVRTVFSGAFDLLSATLYHRHSIQSSRDDAARDDLTTRPLLSVPVPKHEQDTSPGSPEKSKDPMAESLLGEIMGVTKELVENRKKNLKLFYSGTLQRLLQLPPPPPAGSKDPPSRNKDSLSSMPDRETARRGVQNNSDSKQQAPSKEDRSDGQARRQLVRYDDIVSESPRERRREPDKKGKRKEQSRPSPPPLWVEDVEPSEVEILKRSVFAENGESSKKKTEPNEPPADVAQPLHACTPEASIPEEDDLSSTPSIEIEEQLVGIKRRKKNSEGRRSGSSGSSSTASSHEHHRGGRNGATEDLACDSRYQAISRTGPLPSDLFKRITSPPPTTLSSSLFDPHSSLLSTQQARGLAYFVDDESGSDV